MPTATPLGLVGERVAARWLIRRGWRILDHHVRSRRGEIDLVARLGRLVAFVEVKTRSGVEFGDPLEFVGWQKQRRIFHTAQLWTARNGCAQDFYRFDVIGVIACGSLFRVRCAEAAFQLDSFSIDHPRPPTLHPGPVSGYVRTPSFRPSPRTFPSSPRSI